MGSLSHFNLAGIRVLHGIRSLVETGTADGAGVEHARAAGFDHIHSIEIVPELAVACRARFKNDPRVQIWEGDSRYCLPMILKELPPEPCLFWLDAHFPAANTHLTSYEAEPDLGKRLPLRDEVMAIRAARPKSRDVLLIDDARIYVQSKWFGARDRFAQPMADGTWPPLQGVERSLDWLREAYCDTHGVVIDYANQGYVMVFPRVDLKAAEEG